MFSGFQIQAWPTPEIFIRGLSPIPPSDSYLVTVAGDNLVTVADDNLIYI
jgi:hypothetical protein